MPVVSFPEGPILILRLKKPKIKQSVQARIQMQPASTISKSSAKLQLKSKCFGSDVTDHAEVCNPFHKSKLIGAHAQIL